LNNHLDRFIIHILWNVDHVIQIETKLEIYGKPFCGTAKKKARTNGLSFSFASIQQSLLQLKRGEMFRRLYKDSFIIQYDFN
jgi:hypothetical protein